MNECLSWLLQMRWNHLHLYFFTYVHFLSFNNRWLDILLSVWGYCHSLMTKRQLSPQLLSYCSAWNIGVNVQFHFSSSLSSRHTLLPQIIPFIARMEYLQTFVWVCSLQASKGALSTTFSFGCFVYFHGWGINIMTVVLLFRSYSL